MSDENTEILAGRYSLLTEIGQGAFGHVYLGRTLIGSAFVAIKTESIAAKKPQVFWEAKVLQELHGTQGVPKVYWYGPGRGINAMVFELLGPSLDSLFDQRNRLFSPKMTCQLLQQMLKRLKSVHKKGYLHRDVKPANFLVGLGDKENQVYLIDFGLSKRFRDEENEHLPCREGVGLVGTTRYASINAHKGIELSRRDDLEALAYIAIYFCKGKLPWQGLNGDNGQILTMKSTLSLDFLCADCPAEVRLFLSYVRGLAFAQDPDYIYLAGLVKQLAARTNVRLDRFCEWHSPITRWKHRKMTQIGIRYRRKSECGDYFKALTGWMDGSTGLDDSEETVATDRLPTLSEKVRNAVNAAAIRPM